MLAPPVEAPFRAEALAPPVAPARAEALAPLGDVPAPVEPSAEGRPDATANTVRDLAVRDLAVRNPKTAPMLQMPEFEAAAAASSGVRPTLPMAEGQPAPRARPEAARTPLARRLAWATLGLVACGGLALLFVELSGGRFGSWRSQAAPEEPLPTSWLPSPEGQGGTEPVSTTPPEVPEPEPVAVPEPQRPPVRGGVSTQPPAPPAKPAPAPAQPSPTPPSPTPPSPTPPLPAPSAPALPPPLPLPQLPWTLPTAGACERCLQALRGSGHYVVVTAATEALLCEDGAARATCERQIGEVAPDVAERAAREGNCTAALATVAAAVNVRVAPERFGAVNALCLR